MPFRKKVIAYGASALIGSTLVAGVSPPPAYAQKAAHAQTQISITNQTPGPTPFIENITADTSGKAPLSYVTYVIDPKAGSLTRPITVTYSASHLAAEGKVTSTSVTVPVFGLYAGSTNSVSLYYIFGNTPATFSIAFSKTTVTTAPYTDPCNRLNAPAVQQNRTSTSDIGFDLFLLKNSCSSDFPAIVDTDGSVRWVGNAHVSTQSAILDHSAIYVSDGGSGVNKITLDGIVTKLADYAAYNVTYTGHHNFDPGRDGIIIDVNTTTQTESTELEIDPNTGKVLQTWDMSQIIGAAMVAGGDQAVVGQFVYPVGNDWFHNNASTYNRADNTLIVSSRENFVIAVDYDTPADGVKKIHWILGDPTKHWAQFPSLQKFALTPTPGTVIPIGQHGISIDHLGNLLLFDDGAGSLFQQPAGATRTQSAARSYAIDTVNMTANEVFTYAPQGLYSPFCGSVYEATPGNYLVDFTLANDGQTTELQGLGTGGSLIFDIQYPTANFCGAGYNANPIPTTYFIP